MDERSPDGIEQSPESAFSVLGDETRLAILYELAAVTNESGPGEGFTFSELQQRVGVEDSGRFNYHLNELKDEFITKSGEEYVPRFSGLEVVSAVYAGTYGEVVETPTTALDWNCPECREPMTVRYRTDQLVIECDDHGVVTSYPVPPGAFDGRSLEELVTVAFTRAMTNMDLARREICPRCWGITETVYPVEPDMPVFGEERFCWTKISCNRCWLRYTVPLRILIAAHPSVIALYTECGHEPAAAAVGPRSTGSPDICTVDLDESDSTATIGIELGGEQLTLRVDEDCTVVDQERTER